MFTDKVQDTQRNIKTVAEIQGWLINYLAEALEIETNEIDINRPLDEYGLNSSDAIFLTGELEEWLGYELEPTLLYEYPKINELSQHLAT